MAKDPTITIIGSGIIGTVTAHSLSSEHKNVSLLETNSSAANATKQSGGIIRTYHGINGAVIADMAAHSFDR